VLRHFLQLELPTALDKMTLGFRRLPSPLRLFSLASRGASADAAHPIELPCLVAINLLSATRCWSGCCCPAFGNFSAPWV